MTRNLFDPETGYMGGVPGYLPPLECEGDPRQCSGPVDYYTDPFDNSERLLCDHHAAELKAEFEDYVREHCC